MHTNWIELAGKSLFCDAFFCSPSSSRCRWVWWQVRACPQAPRPIRRSASWSSSSWFCCSMPTSASGASRPTARCEPVPCHTAGPWRTSSTTWHTARPANPAKVSRHRIFFSTWLSCGLQCSFNTSVTHCLTTTWKVVEIVLQKADITKLINRRWQE